MNVLVLTPYVAWPLDHGGRIRTHHLLRALAGRHRVVNLAVARKPRDRADAQELERIGVTVRPGLVPEPDLRAPARRIKKWVSVLSGRSSLPRRWHSPEFEALVQAAVSETSFDVAVLETPWMDVYRAALGRLPYVASTQNVESDVLLESAFGKTGFDRKMAERDARAFLLQEAAFFAESAAAIAVSEDDAARIRTLAPSARVAVVENGIDVDRAPLLPPPPPEGPILFVGSFDYPANVEAAIWLVKEVLPRIREGGDPVRVVLAGRGPTAEVRALAGGGVEVTGTLPDLAPTYARARAVVVTIRVGGGTRVKILEALAFGRPVVTTSTGMRGLAVEDGEHVLVADTPDAFAAALARLRSEPGLVPRLVEAGRSFVASRHAWPPLERLFSEAIEAAARTRS